MSEKVSYEIELPGMGVRPAVYDWIGEASGMPFSELAQTFNMGIGMVVVCHPAETAGIKSHIESTGEACYEIGRIVTGDRRVVLR
jgi:phosphoribosylformylglycinamidine cyclo-ligase